MTEMKTLGYQMATVELLANALCLVYCEVGEKARRNAFWQAEPVDIINAINSVDVDLIQTTLDVIGSTGHNSALSRTFRDEVKRRLAAQGLNKSACAGVSCALAHAARKLAVNQ